MIITKPLSKNRCNQLLSLVFKHVKRSKKRKKLICKHNFLENNKKIRSVLNANRSIYFEFELFITNFN